MEEKYIDLLLKKCINFDKSKSLVISYNKVNKDFVNKIVNKANGMGVFDIYLDEEDIKLVKDKLINLTVDEIKNDPYFNKEKWDEYAEKNASFLMLETEFPDFFDDIDPDKITAMNITKKKTRPIFKQKEITYQIPWCIAALPNEIWAKKIFNNDKDALKKLENVIYKMCMVDKDNPIQSWNVYLEKSKYLVDKLNDLEIKSLHYTNGLKTDLYIEMPKDYLWVSAANDKDLNMFVNMPSYEIFSSPDFRKTNGIVYSAKPLVYAGGLIDKFYIEFKDGKVINYNAETGYEILKGIIEEDEHSKYLGEVALVNHNSPISNTNIVFGTTLFDENASCHLALGGGFSECIKDGLDLSKDELLKRGINQANNHVDFMIGTEDLEIEAETKKGLVKIFTNGNFSI